MSVKIGYAGDRKIAVEILSFILEQGIFPSVLIVADNESSSHSHELIYLCEDIEPNDILMGSQIKNPAFVEKIKGLNLDYLICIHFPYIIPETLLNSVKIGVLNLHPAYLPYNRGWHTPTWAIADDTPYGATLHFMDKSLDIGDIVHQKELKISPSDTADSLYQKAIELEIQVFKEAWPVIISKSIVPKSQKNMRGTCHVKQDIKSIQRMNLDDHVQTGQLLKILRALTTNNVKESAYFEQDGKMYRVQVRITEEHQEQMKT